MASRTMALAKKMRRGFFFGSDVSRLTFDQASYQGHDLGGHQAGAVLGRHDHQPVPHIVLA